MLKKHLEKSTVVRYWDVIYELINRLRPHTIHRAYIACEERRFGKTRAAILGKPNIKVPLDAAWRIAKYGIADAARDVRRSKPLVFIKTPPRR